MNALLLAYILLIVAGTIWIVYRVLVYMRTERESESRATELLDDKDFKKYLKELSAKTKAAADQSATDTAEATPVQPQPRIIGPGLPPPKKAPRPPAPPSQPKQGPDSTRQTDRKPQPKPQPRPGEGRTRRQDS